MAGILATRFPLKAPELFAYHASIIRVERNYEKYRWVAYDRQYRREALARKDLNWSAENSRLYNEAFTGRAKAIPRCTFCLQDDHTDCVCPRNPNKPVFGWFPDPSNWHAQAMPHSQPSQEVCRNYNQGRCKKPPHKCRYTHICDMCSAYHPAINCPRNRGNQRGRYRSPPPPPPYGRGSGGPFTGPRAHPTGPTQ